MLHVLVWNKYVEKWFLGHFLTWYMYVVLLSEIDVSNKINVRFEFEAIFALESVKPLSGLKKFFLEANFFWRNSDED